MLLKENCSIDITARKLANNQVSHGCLISIYFLSRQLEEKTNNFAKLGKDSDFLSLFLRILNKVLIANSYIG